MNRFPGREFHTPEYYQMNNEQLLAEEESMRRAFKEIGTECVLLTDKAEYLKLTNIQVDLATKMTSLADGYATDLQKMMSRMTEKDAFIRKLLEFRENLQTLRQVYNKQFGNR